MTCALGLWPGHTQVKKKKKKPYADYDPCPRPMAWARVKNPTQIMTRAHGLWPGHE